MMASGHYPYVENLDIAIKGLKQGLAQLPEKDRKKVGAAVFVEWTTSSSEIESYKKLWIGSR